MLQRNENSKYVFNTKNPIQPQHEVTGASFIVFMCWQMPKLTCSVCVRLCVCVSVYVCVWKVLHTAIANRQ